MTECDDTQASDDMTRAEFIAYIARVYDVPKTLIRYEKMDIEREYDGTSGAVVGKVS